MHGNKDATSEVSGRRVNPLMSEQNICDEIFKCIFVNDNAVILNFIKVCFEEFTSVNEVSIGSENGLVSDRLQVLLSKLMIA